jgi:predicted metal-binding protein
MSDESEKVIKFPEPPKKDEILWECKACHHQITESMEANEEKGSKVLPLNLGGMMIYV